MGHILDITVLGEGEMIRTAVIFFYVANEGLSILENCASLSLPIPEVLKKALAKITEQNDPESEIEKDEDNQ